MKKKKENTCSKSFKGTGIGVTQHGVVCSPLLRVRASPLAADVRVLAIGELLGCLPPLHVLVALPLLRLPPRLLAHVRCGLRQVDADRRRLAEREAARDGREVQLVHVEHVLQLAARVAQQIALVGLPRGGAQVVVGAHQLLQLLLHVLVQLGEVEGVLVDRHAGVVVEVLEEEVLLREEEHEGAAGAPRAGGTPHTVDVLHRVVRRVELDDPVHRRDVQAARGHVGREEHAAGRVAKLHVRRGALVLLLLPVEGDARGVDVVEQLAVEADAVAAAKKDNHLLLRVALHEVVEHEQPLLAGAQHVALLQCVHRGLVLLALHRDEQRRLVEGDARELLHAGRLRRGEEQRLARLGQQRHNLAHVLLEPIVEHAVGLVHGEQQQILRVPVRRQLEVVQQPARRGDDDHDAVGELVPLGAAALAADAAQKRNRAVEELEEAQQHTLYLQAQLAGGAHDDGRRAVARAEPGAGDDFYNGDKEGQRLAGARLGLGQQVAALQRGRDAARLDGGQLLELELALERGHDVRVQAELLVVRYHRCIRRQRGRPHVYLRRVLRRLGGRPLSLSADTNILRVLRLLLSLASF
ncbi:ATP-dependent RNA helicase DDX18/HAS1, partial [Strigomonas culicis]